MLMNQDKVMHFGAGAAIVALAWTVLFGIVDIPLVPALCCGWLLSDAGAISKECYDDANPNFHTTDWLDGQATRAGGSLAAVVIYLGTMLF
jgi:hypothetical protein